MSGVQAIVVESVQMIQENISAAFAFFHKGQVIPGREAMATVTNVISVFESLRVIVKQEETHGAQALDGLLQMILHDENLLPGIVQFVSHPLLYVNEDVASSEVQGTFANLRIGALRTLEQFFVSGNALGLHNTLSLLSGFLSDLQLHESLVAALSASNSLEIFRAAVGEFLFSMSSTRAGLVSLIKANIHRALLALNPQEPSTNVRNFYTSILREVANGQANALADEQALETLLKIYIEDSSPDARVLAAETIVSISQYLEDAPGVDPLLTSFDVATAQAIHDRFQNEQDIAVIAASVRLFERLLTRHAQVNGIRHYVNRNAFFEYNVTNKIERLLVGFLHRRDFTSDLAVASCRALRLFIQLSPTDYQLGGQLLANFNALSGLLKATLDAFTGNATSPSPGFKMELGLIFSLLCSQNPAYREKINREVMSYPEWANTLKGAVLSFLNSTPFELFHGIDVVDSSKVTLNDTEKVIFENDKPDRNSVMQIFSHQEERFQHGGSRQYAPASDANPRDHMNQKRRLKLTFNVLSYAVHLAFGERNPHIEMPTSKGMASYGATFTARTDPSYDYYRGPQPEVPVEPFDLPVKSIHNELSRTGLRGASVNTSRAGTGIYHADPGRPRFPTLTSKPEKVFISASSRDVAAGLTAKEQRELGEAYVKHENAFKLATEFAQHYKENVISDELAEVASSGVQQSVYVSTKDGLVVRKPSKASAKIAKRQTTNARFWSAKDLEYDDLFMFDIHFDFLNVAKAESALDKAYRHMSLLKKAATNPNNTPARLILLDDLLQNVMPHLVDALETLVGLIKNYGEGNVRFAIFMFRENEMHLGEREIHAGNVVSIVDQVDFFFRQDPAAILGHKDVSEAEQEVFTEKIKQLSSLHQAE